MSRCFRDMGNSIVSIGKKIPLRCRSANFQLHDLPLIDFHWTRFAEGIGTVTAPVPQLRRSDQPAFHRIPMYVAQLLRALLWVPHYEVVETSLPHVSFLQHGAPQAVWPGRRSFAKPTQEFAREALLEDLHHDRRGVVVGFADQEVNVFRHDHVADHYGTISDAGLFEDAEEKIAALWRSEQRAALVVAERDEVQIACSVTAPETGGHEGSLSQNLWNRCDESPGRDVMNPPSLHLSGLRTESHPWAQNAQGWGSLARRRTPGYRDNFLTIK